MEVIQLSSKKKEKTNNKIVSWLLLLTIALIIVYVLYKIVGLIAIPSDIVVIEDGLIMSEENAIRVYYTR